MDYLNRAIPDSLLAFLDGYKFGNRRSGQTVEMLSNVKRLDVIVVHTSAVREYCRVWFRDNRAPGFVDDVHFLVCQPNMHDMVEQLQSLRGQTGRLYFDHEWVARLYQNYLLELRKDLDDQVAVFNRRSVNPR